MKKIFTTLLVLSVLFAGNSDVRAEGEYWTPLYNKLTRYINSHYVNTGHMEPIQEIEDPDGENGEMRDETQGEANTRYIEEHAVLNTGLLINQGKLNILRARVLDLATNRYAIDEQRSQMAIEYLTDENDLDDWGNVKLKEITIFTLAELPNANAFTLIPSSYASTPIYSSDFTEGPVLWEHFQEIYDVASKLEFPAHKYGYAKYDEFSLSSHGA